MAIQRSVLLAGVTFIAVLGALGAIAFWPSGDAPDTTSLRPDDTALVALGADIYAAQCASCHGPDLEGQANWQERGADGKLPAPPHDASGHTWHHPDSQLFDLVKNGLPKEVGGVPYLTDMPAYGGTLADEEILAVLSYIKSRWPADVAAQHDEMNARFRTQ